MIAFKSEAFLGCVTVPYVCLGQRFVCWLRSWAYARATEEMAGLNNIPQVPCGLFFLLIQLVDEGEDIVVVMTPHHWGAVIAGSHNAALSHKLAADVRQEFVLHHGESDSRWWNACCARV